jgi:hypothetical protein
MLLVVCVIAGCGASPERHPTRTNAVRPPAADAPAITATLTAVFVHPEASQCRDHQRERAQLARRYRLVTVHNLQVSGHRARAIIRGANGYPIGVSLVEGPGGWRLDGSGTSIQAPGHGQQVAPQGSLYAYRIPPGFVAAGTRVGPVTTTGAAFSTGVRLPGSRPGDGIAIAQTAAHSHIADLAALRSVLPRIDREVRAAPIARVIGPGVAHEVGGRPAVTWTLAAVNAATAPTDG